MFRMLNGAGLIIVSAILALSMISSVQANETTSAIRGKVVTGGVTYRRMLLSR